jgi:hypothetical protein
MNLASVRGPAQARGDAREGAHKERTARAVHSSHSFAAELRDRSRSLNGNKPPHHGDDPPQFSDEGAFEREARSTLERTGADRTARVEAIDCALRVDGIQRLQVAETARGGVAQVELGGGRFTGATMVVVTESRAVRVRLSIPSGSDDPRACAARVERALVGRGFQVDEVDVWHG